MKNYWNFKERSFLYRLATWSGRYFWENKICNVRNEFSRVFRLKKFFSKRNSMATNILTLYFEVLQLPNQVVHQDYPMMKWSHWLLEQQLNKTILFKSFFSICFTFYIIINTCSIRDIRTNTHRIIDCHTILRNCCCCFCRQFAQCIPNSSTI